jgi:hypothetical protein
MKGKLVLAAVVSLLAAAAAGVAAPVSHSAAPARAVRPGGVGLVYLTATPVKRTRNVMVKWKTGAEPNVLGFRLFRVVGKKKTRVGRLFPSKGSTGGVYSYKDLLPKTVKLACYALDEVSTTGSSATVGKACMKKKVNPPV